MFVGIKNSQKHNTIHRKSSETIQNSQKPWYPHWVLPFLAVPPWLRKSRFANPLGYAAVTSLYIFALYMVTWLCSVCVIDFKRVYSWLNSICVGCLKCVSWFCVVLIVVYVLVWCFVYSTSKFVNVIFLECLVLSGF